MRGEDEVTLKPGALGAANRTARREISCCFYQNEQGGRVGSFRP